MDLPSDKLAEAIGGSALVTAGFVARWIWDRFWRKKDEQRVALADHLTEQQRAKEAAVAAALATHAGQLSELRTKQTEISAQEEGRQRMLGNLEARHNQLDGRLDGLQTFWRTEFTKMREDFTKEFTKLEEKVDYRLDNLRMELRGDQQKFEERFTELLTGHQGRMHDRINAMAAEQAGMLNRLIDELADRAGEPRMSPPKVT